MEHALTSQIDTRAILYDKLFKLMVQNRPDMLNITETQQPQDDSTTCRRVFESS